MPRKISFSSLLEVECKNKTFKSLSPKTGLIVEGGGRRRRTYSNFNSTTFRTKKYKNMKSAPAATS